MQQAVCILVYRKLNLYDFCMC